MSHVAPMRSLNRPKPTVSIERRADGVLVLSAGRDLPDGLPLMIDWLQRAVLLTQRVQIPDCYCFMCDQVGLPVALQGNAGLKGGITLIAQQRRAVGCTACTGNGHYYARRLAADRHYENGLNAEWH